MFSGLCKLSGTPTRAQKSKLFSGLYKLSGTPRRAQFNPKGLAVVVSAETSLELLYK
ncbi:MAG: hypothetical protein WAT71_02285 [Ignavibacteria bacterium]